jgi:hypothetical protein
MREAPRTTPLGRERSIIVVLSNAEVAVSKLVMGFVLLLVVPALRAQQGERQESPTPPAEQTVPQDSTAKQSEGNSLPPSLRPGHPLDPADVDILTGKRDREIEAARRAGVPTMIGAYPEYGTYGDYYWMNGRVGRVWDIPILPLSRITSPFFFSRISPGGFGRGGFRGGR